MVRQLMFRNRPWATGHWVRAGVWLPLEMTAGDMENQAELEEKTRLINQVLELQHTLEGAENLFSLLHTCTSVHIQLIWKIMRMSPPPLMHSVLFLGLFVVFIWAEIQGRYTNHTHLSCFREHWWWSYLLFSEFREGTPLVTVAGWPLGHILEMSFINQQQLIVIEQGR